MTRPIVETLAATALFFIFCYTADAKLFPEQIEPGDDWSPEQVETWKFNNLIYSLKEIVYSSTRYPKQIRHIADNITVVDAQDIERMQAHTLSEVLTRVTGLFVTETSHDFGGTSHIDVQGSNQDRVLVLVDGVKWNSLFGNNVETNAIPIGIIKKIEIIKGPASSVWGSALGGVIHIITKQGESELMPEGMVSASYGERGTLDSRAEISGTDTNLSYYLYTQHQSSHGLKNNRDFTNNSLYGKLITSFSHTVQAGASFGLSAPEQTTNQYPDRDLAEFLDTNIYWGKLFADSRLTDQATLHLSLHHRKQKAGNGRRTLGRGIPPFPSHKTELIKTRFTETATLAKTRLTFKTASHTAVTGMEYTWEKLNLKMNAMLPPDFGMPYTDKWDATHDKFALYANDTIVLGNVSLIPGVRYDHSDITGTFVSPSFGTTLKTGPATVLRASVARGFSAPPLGYLSLTTPQLTPNKDLDAEEIRSCQAGFETAAINYLLLKSTLFFHNVNDTLTLERVDNGKVHLINSKGSIRKGFEVEIKTSRYKDFAITTGLSYVHTKPQGKDAHNKYTVNVDLLYDDLTSYSALLSGRYIHSELDKDLYPDYTDNMIWDFNAGKKINFLFYLKRSIEIFGSIHNLFNGNQYHLSTSKNPGRWVEGGVRLRF